MIVIHCERCQANYIVGYREMISLHNTSEGPVGYIRCPKGHLNIDTIVPAFEGADPTPVEVGAKDLNCVECGDTTVPTRRRTTAA